MNKRYVNIKHNLIIHEQSLANENNEHLTSK